MESDLKDKGIPFECNNCGNKPPLEEAPKHGDMDQRIEELYEMIKTEDGRREFATRMGWIKKNEEKEKT